VPTIPGIEGPYRLFFYSFDCREPVHVHVERDDSTASSGSSPSLWQRTTVSPLGSSTASVS